MKRMARFILVVTLLVVAAQPVLACPVCDFQGGCTGGGGIRCKPTIDGFECTTPCGGGLTDSLASEYSIASVEVTNGTDAKVALAENNIDKKTDAPAAIADARIENHK